MTPADALAARAFDPFCANGILSAVNALADFSHSNAMAQLVAAGRYRSELLMTLGKVAPPRYASFIGRYRDDPDPSVRRAVALALGLVVGNEAVTLPVLIQLLSRGEQPGDFPVKWEAAASLVRVARRGTGDGARRRLAELLREGDAVTVVLAARALAATGDARGVTRLRELTSHKSPQVREEAVLALGEIGDGGSAEAATRRLKDESLTVRAAAVYALGRIGGPSVAPTLRQATQESLEYERGLERRRQGGEPEQVLRERYGFRVYDLRETLQQAIATAGPPATR